MPLIYTAEHLINIVQEHLDHVASRLSPRSYYSQPRRTPPLVVVVRTDRHGLLLVVLAAPRAPLMVAAHMSIVMHSPSTVVHAAPRAPLMVVVRMSTAMGTPLITSLAVPRAPVVVAACMHHTLSIMLIILCASRTSRSSYAPEAP